MKIFYWLLSQTVRHAVAMHRHVEKILQHQRDLLAPKAISEVEAALRAVDETIMSKADKAALAKQMENLEEAANKWLKPYPNAEWRENMEVLLVAFAVAMAIRTFFLQPFKIPTGSMQPTLYGVTSANLMHEADLKIPTGWQRIVEWFQGASYVHVVAPADGTLESIDEQPFRILIFNIKQSLRIGGETYTIWFPPDCGEQTLKQRAGVEEGMVFHKGDDVMKLKVIAGDHLFVDRISYNFRAPERGQIVVFETKGIPEERRETPFWHIPPDQFYIKRLVGLSDETLSIHQDYTATNVPHYGSVPVGHLVVNGHPLSASTSHFENLYSFYGASRGSEDLPYLDNHYYGHAMMQLLEPGREFHVGKDNYFVMGDNTMNSLDSRYWADFPATSVVGKAFFVYWPITSRFGQGYR